MANNKIYVACAECGAEVDRLEFTGGPVSQAVLDVMSGLNKTQEEATALVAAENPGAEKTNEEQTRALADAIVAKSVVDRDPETYDCPNGHTGALAVTDVEPTAGPVVSILRIGE